MTDCKLTDAEREDFRRHMDRRPPRPYAWLFDGETTPTRGGWRDFDSPPCAAGCSQGRVAVEVRDGTFGFVMVACPTCSAPEVSSSNGT